jgi:RNA polymerase sigma factor (sigma-70 family)
VTDWQAIVDEHGPQVWRTVHRLVSNYDDALDCYQETFLQAARYSAKRTVSNWGALLRQMASMRALDCLRQRYRTAAMTPLHAADASSQQAREPSPDVQAQMNELMERLRQALPKLPPRHAEVFCLREIELMSTAEVARQLGVTPDEVATWLHRAKTKLSQLVLEREEGSERSGNEPRRTTRTDI